MQQQCYSCSLSVCQLANHRLIAGSLPVFSHTRTRTLSLLHMISFLGRKFASLETVDSVLEADTGFEHAFRWRK